MSGKSTMKNFKAMIAGAKQQERSVMVCLRGDLVADHEAAVRELERVTKDPIDSLAGNGATELAERIEALEAEMLENSIEFRLRTMPKRDFRELHKQHPPRRDPETDQVVDSDRRIGANFDTYFSALLRHSTIEPQLDDEDWLGLLGHTDAEITELKAAGRDEEIVEGALSQPQWDKLTDAAWAVNGNEVSIPFSLAASRMRRTTENE